jgi:hypothetical protein
VQQCRWLPSRPNAIARTTTAACSRTCSRKQSFRPKIAVYNGAHGWWPPDTPVYNRPEAEIGELVYWASKSRFQQAEIANAVRAPEQRQLLSLKIKHDVEVEPFRLAHFASALNVSAYSRNARLAISIAFACFGS